MRGCNMERVRFQRISAAWFFVCWSVLLVAGGVAQDPGFVEEPGASVFVDDLIPRSRDAVLLTGGQEPVGAGDPAQEKSIFDRPEVLQPLPPGEVTLEEFQAPPVAPDFVRPLVRTPLGYTGASGIRPSEAQQSLDFVPIEDRWRAGFPDWQRYSEPNPRGIDQPYEKGHWWDPYNQNVLKGDYPIIGQHTFLNITATNFMLHEFRQTPIPTSPFESTVGAGQREFYGDPDQYFFVNNLKLQFNLSHGDAGFKPFDWQVRLAPVLNMNYLDVNELAVVNPDVRRGTTRYRQDAALEEWFVEAKLADLSPDYDFLSVRAGSQPFVSDFRGFVFADTNRAVRVFGTRLANRDQFNVI
ncbi:MAG: hypothetical protein ACKOEO_23610, partial [Planctomycetaceae bacterium]